ncbi:MAG: sigma-54 dependent transcriptional regulator [Lysobacteraceae bacterium]
MGAPHQHHLLLVEDDPTQRELVRKALHQAGYRVSEANGLDAATQLLDDDTLSLVVSDFKLADGDGLQVLAEVRRRRPELSFVLVTAYGSIEHAVTAIQAGADDYLAKPFERQALLLTVERALRTRDLREENRRLNDELETRDRLLDLTGKAPAMQKLYRQIEKLAPTEAGVLIQGESGTGKELVARALHRLSRRSDGPFVAVNCGAIPEGLAEAEFFGAERGAFTGAVAARDGYFAQAHGGTLFLDEVGELPLALQPKLLRALQEGVITRVGGQREQRVDVRIVAATHRDLKQEIAESRFREDLYYRLAVVTLNTPPLRERREDIPLLVDHFVERATKQHGLSGTTLPKAVLRALMERDWPGNVRELGHAIERLLLLGDDDDLLEHDVDHRADRDDGGFHLPDDGLDWERMERSLLAQALERSDGNRRQAARLLGLGYKAFLYRIEKFGLGGD